MRSKTGDRAVQKNRKKRARTAITSGSERAMAAQRNSRLFATGKSKGGKIMKAMGGKMMKSKGYSKGGTRMMKAMGGKMASKGGTRMMRAMKGKMAKGYSKGGTRMMMKAMGGKMAKGYAKGGTKMIRAQGGKEIKRPKNMISSVRTMKKDPMTKRQLQLGGAKAMLNRPKLKVKPTSMKPLPASVQKIAGAIDKLPKAGKLALFGTYIAGLGYGTKKAIDYLGPKASRAGKAVRELKKKKIQEMKKKKK